MTGAADVLTPDVVETQISQCLDDLEEATVEYEVRAMNAATAEVTYKVAYAQRLLQASGTVAEREALATYDTFTELSDRRATEALLGSAKEVLLTLRARLSALQTLSSSVRAQT